jgi:hypothetical protein
MSPEPLAPVDVRTLETRGEFRRVRNGPRTLQTILAEAAEATDLEVAVSAYLRGKPIPGMRHPRRTLRRLLRRTIVSVR